MSTPRFERPRRVVVKIGSSSLTASDGGLARQVVTSICEQVADLAAGGVEVVLVSSGAVAAGLRPLGMTSRPTDLGEQQAAASVGQGVLIHAYTTDLATRGLVVGQVLLTPDDVIDRRRYLNARTTFTQLLSRGAIPVVNENDTVVTDELRFGDNDRLAALATSMLGADLLLLLSDVEGLHDGPPSSGAPLISQVDDLATLGERHHGPSTSAVGTGGMASKLEAARIATFSAASCVIARARREDVIREVCAGSEVGTWFPPSSRRPDSRRLWTAFAHRPTGAVTVDAGAAEALRSRGSSLLAIGVTGVTGEFESGDAIDILTVEGHTIARGVTTFDADHVRQVRGRRSLGQDLRPVVHRDQMVLTA